jgi:hypothetical protein
MPHPGSRRLRFGACPSHVKTLPAGSEKNFLSRCEYDRFAFIITSKFHKIEFTQGKVGMGIALALALLGGSLLLLLGALCWIFRP